MIAVGKLGRFANLGLELNAIGEDAAVSAANLLHEGNVVGYLAETSESDGRKNYIRLSEKTKGFSDAFKERSRQLYERIEKDLSKKELEVFSEVIDKIREHIREAEDETDL